MGLFFSILLFTLTKAEPSSCLHLAHLLRAGQNTLHELETGNCLTKLVPAYKWAQNMSHILVKVELHTSTHPQLCDLILHQQAQAYYDHLEVRTICEYGSTLLDYQLNVKTFKSLDFGTAQWTTQGQSSLVLECLKSPAPYFWPILHSRVTVPHRMGKVWWEMMGRYGDQLRKVIDLLEIGDSDTDISRRDRKRKQVKSQPRPNFSCRTGSPEFVGSWL